VRLGFITATLVAQSPRATGLTSIGADRDLRCLCPVFGLIDGERPVGRMSPYGALDRIAREVPDGASSVWYILDEQWRLDFLVSGR